MTTTPHVITSSSSYSFNTFSINQSPTNKPQSKQRGLGIMLTPPPSAVDPSLIFQAQTPTSPSKSSTLSFSTIIHSSPLYPGYYSSPVHNNNNDEPSSSLITPTEPLITPTKDDFPSRPSTSLGIQTKSSFYAHRVSSMHNLSTHSSFNSAIEESKANATNRRQIFERRNTPVYMQRQHSAVYSDSGHSHSNIILARHSSLKRRISLNINAGRAIIENHHNDNDDDHEEDDNNSPQKFSRLEYEPMSRSTTVSTDRSYPMVRNHTFTSTTDFSANYISRESRLFDYKRMSLESLFPELSPTNTGIRANDSDSISPAEIGILSINDYDESDEENKINVDDNDEYNDAREALRKVILRNISSKSLQYQQQQETYSIY